MLRNCLLILSLLSFAGPLWCQNPNHRGFSYFQKYEDKLISEETQQKHTFSIGTGATIYTSELFDPIRRIAEGSLEADVALPLMRFGVGYHYFFLKKRKLTVFSKNRFEASGFSIYANIYGRYLQEGLYSSSQFITDSLPRLSADEAILPQFEVRVTYMNPNISYRGKLFNFYFLHEFGLSINRGVRSALLPNPETITNTFVNIVPLSIKFGRRPIFFKSSFNFDFDNQLLKREKIRGTIGFELQIYFYRTK